MVKMGVKKIRSIAILIVYLIIFTHFVFSTLPSFAAESSAPSGTGLDVTIDVGSIFFRGEVAEFYILVSQGRNRVNAEIQANLYYSGSLFADLTSLQQSVEAGLFRIPYTVPMNASSGSYVLVVDAVSSDANCVSGTGLKSFHIGQTFSDWNAWLAEMRGEIAKITSDIESVKTSLTSIDMTLTRIDDRIAAIQDAVGTNSTSINDIEVALTRIEGDIASINATLGTIQSDLSSIRDAMSDIKALIGSNQFNMTGLNASIAVIENALAIIQTGVDQAKTSLNSIDSRFGALEGAVNSIQAILGTIEASTSSIDAKIASTQLDIAKVTTDLGDLNGTVMSIQGDIAGIKADIGKIQKAIDSPISTSTATSLWWVLVAVIAISAVSTAIYLAANLRKRET